MQVQEVMDVVSVRRMISHRDEMLPRQAAIYLRSPVRLPAPAIMAEAERPAWSDKTARVLQEVAWKAVTQFPLSGVREQRTTDKGR